MKNLSWAGALILALLLGGVTSLFVRVGAVGDLASRLEEALIEGEQGRLATCQEALPDDRRLWVTSRPLGRVVGAIVSVEPEVRIAFPVSPR